jgi:hypothetical protein
MVRGLRQPSVACRLDDVSRLVDDHRRVAAADAEGRPAGAVRRLDHRRPAGRQRQVALRHQSLGQRNRRLLDALEHVCGGALAHHHLAQDADHFARRSLGTWVGREDDGVARLDRVDRRSGRGQLRVRHRHDRGDHAGRFGVFDQPLVGILLDDTDALRAQRVAEDAVDLEPFGGAAVAVADAALVDAHVGQAGERRLVAERPADRLGKAVDTPLVVLGDRGHCSSRLGDHLGDEGLLCGRDVARHSSPSVGGEVRAPLARRVDVQDVPVPGGRRRVVLHRHVQHHRPAHR